MTNREKIIVGGALAAIVYGVYTVFLSAPAPPSFTSTNKPLESLTTFITKVADAAKSGLPEKDKNIIQLAEAKWKQDPLVQIEKAANPEVEAKETAPPPTSQIKIAYTGYLQMGDLELAVINGNEYAAGDLLETGGYIVQSIFPNRIVIVTTDGSKNKFIVPMEETQ
jgi:hypothetical protein